jgi:UDP-glucuronate 4-epimerase
VYGGNTKMPFAEGDSVDHPVSLYAATKKANELMAYSYSHLYGLPTTGLRFFTVYGPWGRPDMAYFLFTKAILANQPIDVFNEGDMKRDFIYIDDIVEYALRIIDLTAITSPTSPVPHHVLNIGNHEPVQLLDFISCIEKKLGKTAHKRLLPMQDGDVPATYADMKALSEWVGFIPATPLSQGIDKFIDWYVRYYSTQIIND